MKAYVTERLQYNLDWYRTTCVEGRPNALGVIDGSGPPTDQKRRSPPT